MESAHSDIAVERRRSPRYGCGGAVQILSLPWEGALLWGKLCNLGFGGCYIETGAALQCETRTEIVLRSNGLSMRAMGQVRAVRGHSGMGIEFVRMSTRAYSTLADLMHELEKFRGVVRSPHSAAQVLKSVCLPVPSVSVALAGEILPPLPAGEATAAMERRLRTWEWLVRTSELDVFG